MFLPFYYFRNYWREKAPIKDGVFLTASTALALWLSCVRWLRTLCLILLMKRNAAYVMKHFLMNVQVFICRKKLCGNPIRNVSCIDLKSIFSGCVYCFKTSLNQQKQRKR